VITVDVDPVTGAGAGFVVGFVVGAGVGAGVGAAVGGAVGGIVAIVDGVNQSGGGPNGLGGCASVDAKRPARASNTVNTRAIL